MSFMPSIIYKKDDKEDVSDLLTKMLDDRVIMLMTPVNNISMTSVISQLLYLNVKDPSSPIQLYISSTGGSVLDGYGIIDTMNLITSPVTTVCMGLAASMGSLILSAGVKGKRFVFPGGKVMIHQPSVEFLYGQATDLEIQAKQIVKTKELTASILAKNCGQKKDKVLKDMDRDYWMDAQESIQYGIVDDIYKIV